MTKEERITQAIFNAVDTVNQGRAASQQVEKSHDAVLLGAGGVLDSLGLVNLIVAIEEGIQDEFGVTVNIADEQARAQATSPFTTIQALTGYIATLLEATDR